MSAQVICEPSEHVVRRSALGLPRCKPRRSAAAGGRPSAREIRISPAAAACGPHLVVLRERRSRICCSNGAQRQRPGSRGHGQPARGVAQQGGAERQRAHRGQDGCAGRQVVRGRGPLRPRRHLRQRPQGHLDPWDQLAGRGRHDRRLHRRHPHPDAGARPGRQQHPAGGVRSRTGGSGTWPARNPVRRRLRRRHGALHHPPAQPDRLQRRGPRRGGFHPGRRPEL